MRRTQTWLLIPAILTALAVSCSAVASDQATPPPLAATPTSAVSRPPVLPMATPNPSSNADARPAVDAAVRDAAERLGLATDDVQVHQVEARQWPDSSLGCPQQGVMYSQIVTPGYLVIVSAAGGRQLEYHADSRGRIVFCQQF